MARVTIEVTQQDIASGVRGSSEFCPITIAIRRQLGSNLWASNMNRGAALISLEGPSRQGRPICDLPVECTHFMDDFQDRLTVRPFAFTFEFRVRRLLGRTSASTLALAWEAASDEGQAVS